MDRPAVAASFRCAAAPGGSLLQGDKPRERSHACRHGDVGIENGDAVAAIDTSTNEVIAAIPNGQAAQALVYIPQAVPTESTGGENLQPLGIAGCLRRPIASLTSFASLSLPSATGLLNFSRSARAVPCSGW